MSAGLPELSPLVPSSPIRMMPRKHADPSFRWSIVPSRRYQESKVEENTHAGSLVVFKNVVLQTSH